jgi:hypothetical protein
MPKSGWDEGLFTGSRITNSDGTCRSTGGFTTGSDGAVKGVMLQRAAIRRVAVLETLAAPEDRNLFDENDPHLHDENGALISDLRRSDTVHHHGTMR